MTSYVNRLTISDTEKTITIGINKTPRLNQIINDASSVFQL